MRTRAQLVITHQKQTCDTVESNLYRQIMLICNQTSIQQGAAEQSKRQYQPASKVYKCIYVWRRCRMKQERTPTPKLRLTLHSNVLMEWHEDGVCTEL